MKNTPTHRPMVYDAMTDAQLSDRTRKRVNSLNIKDAFIRRTPPSSDDERSRRSKQPKKHIISETLDFVNYKTSINQFRSPPHK
ncbi:uncharacterized protein OCT59_016947 [Rhizophagus irregularis]|uniref:uncharacterized protein n=1 Tax=Rhizophagus irregularis TaxID=588596 RepID=UPI0019EB66E2|nr:hypothetical protein OCT59_016947 [Rhizophagus irregularis]GET52762.1 hypothetical protein RIR_jg39892.t1 [Rhizophagus irregularis DAOM 181602=DAOM 197198]